MATYDEVDPLGILELPEKVIDPDNPDWHILPVIRGIDDHFMKIWRICQKHGGLIIGGYVRYMISPNGTLAPASDIDVFVGADGSSPLMQVEERYKELQTAFSAMFDTEREGPLSWYYSNPDTGEKSVNLIRPRIDDSMVTVGTVYDIIGMMDFPIVRCGLKNLGEAIADPDFINDETSRQLRWKHINCPIAGVYRMLKYVKKGYFVRPKEVTKLFQDWEERTESYRAALTEALQDENLDEEGIMKLEALMWVD